MWAAEQMGLMRTPPPKQITASAEAKGDTQPQSRSTFTASWVAAHLGFGMGCGAVFALIRRFLPGNAVLAGLLYGGAVWGVNYAGLLPALGLYPAPDDDSSTRTATMIAAHAVYGVSLAELAS
jgi:uncharacterized membrane protein YagU involved in acid resistance